MPKPNDDPLSDLRQAIRDLHGCESEWIEVVPVHETHAGTTVWEGAVRSST